MFGYVNEHILMGNVGDNPEVNTTKMGKTVVRFRVATAIFWLGKDNEKKSETEWHNVVAFGLNAKIASKLKKGDKVYLVGRSHNHAYDGESGEKKYFHEIILDERSRPIEIILKKSNTTEKDQEQLDNEIMLEASAQSNSAN